MKLMLHPTAAPILATAILLPCAGPLAAAGEAATSAAQYSYEQRVFGAPEPLVSSARGQAALARFGKACEQMGKPRFILRINPSRDSAAAESPTLADQQTRRDIERLFGRPLRLAGALLIDHGAEATEGATGTDAAAGSGSPTQPAGESPAADIVIEVLVSSRQVAFASDGATTAVPDIQATAIRVSDRTVLGQAASSDLVGFGAAAGEKARHYSTEEIVEATAFALIEDLAAIARETPKP